MSTTVESLELEIKSSSESAVSGVEALAKSLERLKGATSGGLGLNSVAKGLENVKNATDRMGNITNNLNGLARAVKELSNLGNIKVSASIGNQITKIGTALSTLNLGDGADKIKGLVAALKPLETLGKSSLGTTVNALNKLPEALNKIDTRQLYGQIQSLTRIMKPLADEMQKVANGFNAFPSRIQRLISDNERLTQSNNRTGTSYVNLYAKLKMAYNVIKTGAKYIATAISKMNDYIENINLFNVSMGEYAKEAGEYAEQVGELMGIDPGEWMRNQGMFMTLATGFGVVSDRAYIMSKNLTQLGYDLSSFFNIPYEDAMAKLQSGLAGELEPLRRIGYDLSQARLQQEAYTLGINKKISAMTQAEKAELRYHAIMTQVTTAHGDMARTLTAPANQLRVFTAQVTQAARAVGSIFIPALNAILPYAIAVAKVIRIVASSIASLFGFEMPEVDYSGVGSLASGVDDAATSLGDAAKSSGDTAKSLEDAADKAKELKKYTMGFDELNVIDPDTGDTDKADKADKAGGAGGLGGAGGGGGFDFALPEYDFLSDLISSKVDDIVASMMATISDVFFEWGDELNAENLLEKIVVGLGAITGGYIGWKLGGVKGAIIGATIGMVMGLIIDGLVFDHDGKVSFTELFDVLRDVFIVGTGGILGFTIGGMQGAAIGIAIGFSLTMILEGLEMSGKDSAANGLENALMAIVPVGLGVGLGKKVGETFLQGFDTVFTTGAGTLQSFSAGLSSVSGSLTALQKGVVGVVGGIAEFLAVFTGVKNITFDVANGSSSLGSILSGMITIVAGLTAGFIAFSIAFNSTGIGLIVTLCAAAVAALVGVAAGIDEAGKKAYEKTTDFAMMEDIIKRSSTTIDNCGTALDNMKSGIDKINVASDTFTMASTLVDEIMDINENANASAYELAEMQTKVEVLNGLGIEGLSLSIDETTGRVVETREAVEKLISSLEQEAKMEAMRDLLVQTYKDQFTAQSDLVKATNDYNVASEALQKTRDALNNSEGLSFKQKRELRAAEEEQITALNSAVDAVNSAKTTYDALGETIKTYSSELTDMKLNEMGVGDELVKGLDNVEDALTDTAKNMPKLGKDVADGLKKGVTQNVKKKDYESVWSKIGNWFKDLFGIHSPSTVFAEYGKNILDGLFNSIRDKFSSGKETIVKWATSVKDWFTKGDGSGTIFENFKGYATDIISDFKSKIGEKYIDVKSNLTTWSTKVREWFTNGDGKETIFSSFTSYAGTIITNFSDKISKNYTDGKTLMTTWSSKVREWFTNDESGGTIFDKFTSFGSTIVSNLSTSIDKGVVLSNYETYFGRIKTALESVKNNIKGVVNSIIGFVESMTNGIIKAINGMITGLNKLSIKVPEGVPGLGGTNFGFNIGLLPTISIPRLMADGGFLEKGQAFIARESGPELVGTIGRRTAVANNDQIVAGIASGVAEANGESNALLREQNSLLRAMLEKESGVYLDGKSITKSVEKHQRERGRVLVTGGAY